MRYSPLIHTAMQIACRAHAGQLDKAGYPYIHHPLYLAQQLEDEYAVCAALLHDVMEDTGITFDELAQVMPEEVMEALRLLTHDEKTPYMDYVRAIRHNPIARAVKLADLRHNSDLSRLDQITPQALERVEKYAQAIRLLSE